MAASKRNRRRHPHVPAQRAQRKPRGKGARAGKTRQHPLFGAIPLLPDPEREGAWKYDLDYEPPMPRGAVRGSPRRQDFCPMCHVPRYFYVDQDRECVQCGAGFDFSAAEQKYWYETLRFHFDSVAIRCPTCRRRQRTQKAIHAQIAAAKRALRDDRDDPTHLIALAEATARYRELTGEGDLDGAIAAARRARERWPEAVEAIFWEARCQQLAGRAAKARAAYGRFVLAASVTRRLRPLVELARRALEG